MSTRCTSTSRDLLGGTENTWSRERVTRNQTIIFIKISLVGDSAPPGMVFKVTEPHLNEYDSRTSRSFVLIKYLPKHHSAGIYKTTFPEWMTNGWRRRGARGAGRADAFIETGEASPRR
ncbi:hypothetical protein EVAR_94399_1 [Eumeta japonica]|uniref:Uncharacterized protein n=1 Tax=Eumeta variegata TaxID=151549 RepID=A0A4C1TQ30_EUMVA|nr:hypothetical protein EVAR_94399_1 [Eumeta japonica]